MVYLISDTQLDDKHAGKYVMIKPKGEAGASQPVNGDGGEIAACASYVILGNKSDGHGNETSEGYESADEELAEEAGAPQLLNGDGGEDASGGSAAGEPKTAGD